MFELSPEDTAMNASASLIPASSRTPAQSASGGSAPGANVQSLSVSQVIRRPGRSRTAIFKTILLGRTQPSWYAEHAQLPKALALPILSSDALSSVAYATEQIMLVVLSASTGALHLVTPIAFAIAA